MSRAAFGVITIVLMLWVLACGSEGRNQERVTGPDGGVLGGKPTPTSTPAPTSTPIDFTQQCGPPLSERYCAVFYRRPPSSCPVSQPSRIRSDGLIGLEGPVWKVGDPVIRFEPLPEGEANKTVWIVDDDVSGEVEVRGRRLDGPDSAIFPLYERDPDYYGAGTYQKRWNRTELVLIPPHGLYEDHRTEVFYPSAGCWQFTARTETETVEIVQYLYPVDPP